MQLFTSYHNKEELSTPKYGTEVIPGDKTWCKKCESCSCKMKGKDKANG
jgi:hypothetical protein